MSSQVPDLESKILTERSVEKLLFLKTKPGVLLVAYADGHVRFWDAFMGEGMYLERHCGHEGGAGVIVMCTDPENQVCTRVSTITVPRTGRVRLVESGQVGELLAALENLASVLSKLLPPERLNWPRLACIRTWAWEKGCPLASLNASNGINALFSVLQMEQVLATGGADGRVKVWDISGFDGTRYANDDMRQDEAMLETAHWQAHAGALTSVEYVPKGRMLVTAAQVSDCQVPAAQLSVRLFHKRVKPVVMRVHALV
jgi:WD40 repeat protein